MHDIMNKLFNESASVGVIPEVDYHNHIINESILLEMVNNDTNALNKVLAEAGKYAVRDNLLEDAAPVVNTIKTFATDKPYVCSSVLAIAKEANDPDYELFVKAHLLTKSLMKNLKEKYSTQANERVEKCKSELQNNPRIMTAVSNAMNNE